MNFIQPIPSIECLSCARHYSRYCVYGNKQRRKNPALSLRSLKNFTGCSCVLALYRNSRMTLVRVTEVAAMCWTLTNLAPGTARSSTDKQLRTRPRKDISGDGRCLEKDPQRGWTTQHSTAYMNPSIPVFCSLTPNNQDCEKP